MPANNAKEIIHITKRLHVGVTTLTELRHTTRRPNTNPLSMKDGDLH